MFLQHWLIMVLQTMRNITSDSIADKFYMSYKNSRIDCIT